MSQQQQNNHAPEVGVVYGICVAILLGIAHTAEVFLRKPGTIGKHTYNGVVPLFSFIGMAIWAYAWSQEYVWTSDPSLEIGPFVLFWIGWSLVCWVHILGRGLRDRFGWWYPPLNYDGTPWLRWGKWGEEKIKERLEPAVVFLAGGLIGLAGNTPLGLWLMIAGFCLGGAQSHDRWVRKERVREWDMMMDRQEQALEDMRRWGRRRW